MSRYIEADKVLKELRLNHNDVIYIDKNETAKRIEKIPSIDLADYVPRDFHDKTCEAMAKAHQEEIADMVRIADRPQGEWIDEADEYDASFGIHDYRCSNCNSYADEYIGGHEWYTAGKPNFCPYCGADMREREGE